MYLDDYNALFMYLCEVAIVSQLCISFPYVLHGLYEDYLTCDIAFNAVMPLSRASTRGRYSRIKGVTISSWSSHFVLILCSMLNEEFLHGWPINGAGFCQDLIYPNE